MNTRHCSSEVYDSCAVHTLRRNMGADLKHAPPEPPRMPRLTGPHETGDHQPGFNYSAPRRPSAWHPGDHQLGAYQIVAGDHQPGFESKPATISLASVYFPHTPAKLLDRSSELKKTRPSSSVSLSFTMRNSWHGGVLTVLTIMFMIIQYVLRIITMMTYEPDLAQTWVIHIISGGSISVYSHP